MNDCVSLFFFVWLLNSIFSWEKLHFFSWFREVVLKTLEITLSYMAWFWGGPLWSWGLDSMVLMAPFQLRRSTILPFYIWRVKIQHRLKSCAPFAMGQPLWEKGLVWDVLISRGISQLFPTRKEREIKEESYTNNTLRTLEEVWSFVIKRPHYHLSSRIWPESLTEILLSTYFQNRPRNNMCWWRELQLWDCNWDINYLQPVEMKLASSCSFPISLG